MQKRYKAVVLIQMTLAQPIFFLNNDMPNINMEMTKTGLGSSQWQTDSDIPWKAWVELFPHFNNYLFFSPKFKQ